MDMVDGVIEVRQNKDYKYSDLKVSLTNIYKQQVILFNYYNHSPGHFYSMLQLKFKRESNVLPYKS